MTRPDSPLTQARRRDTARRHQAVITALDKLATTGGEITVASVARAAGVHRSFLYRHPDLHATLTSHANAPAATNNGPPPASRQSLLTDLANLRDRSRRQDRHITALEHKLSQALGQAVWHDSGLGGPDDLDTLQHRITHLEEQLHDLRLQLEDRTSDLDAARAANRDLIAALNTSPATPVHDTRRAHKPTTNSR